jgi:hypothetical protein
MPSQNVLRTEGTHDDDDEPNDMSLNMSVSSLGREFHDVYPYGGH